MKVRLEKSALVDAVAYAARMLPAKAPMPVLSGIMLSAAEDATVMAGGSLDMSVFDYEKSAQCGAAGDVMEPGRVLVSGRMLAEIVKSLPARPVEITTDGSKVRITCGTAKFILLTMPVDDYPSMPAMPDGAGVIPGDVFTSAVAQVAVAASKDDTPPALAGVRIEIDGDRVRMMATDRYRLAVKEFGWRPSDGNYQAAALVRAWTLSEVARSLPPGVDVTVGLGDLIGFSAAGRQSTSLLMDGEYPKAMSLFPATFVGYAVVNTASLVEAVKRVALVAEKNTPIGLDFTDGSVTLDGGQGEDAQGEETVDAHVPGEPIMIRFNPAFLLDGLGAIPHQYVRFSFNRGDEGQSNKPAVLTGQDSEDGPDDESYRYLLMPMRP